MNPSVLQKLITKEVPHRLTLYWVDLEEQSLFEAPTADELEGLASRDVADALRDTRDDLKRVRQQRDQLRAQVEASGFEVNKLHNQNEMLAASKNQQRDALVLLHTELADATGVVQKSEAGKSSPGPWQVCLNQVRHWRRCYERDVGGIWQPIIDAVHDVERLGVCGDGCDAIVRAACTVVRKHFPFVAKPDEDDFDDEDKARAKAAVDILHGKAGA